MASESVSRLLDENADLKPLTSRLAHIKRLQRRYRTFAPERLADSSRVCAIDGTIVVICADSAPVAAALRHLGPRILEELRRAALANSSKHPRDQELTGIRIEVQVKVPPARQRVHARSEMPAEKISGVAGRLSDSPLKSTLERIARDAQSRRTRSKT
jgi:Dna[CI] antecedent, DciA